MCLNVWNDIGKWFSDLFSKIAKCFEPIIAWFNETTEPIKEFFVANDRNPILWIGLVLIGLALFELAYKALHKD